MIRQKYILQLLVSVFILFISQTLFGDSLPDPAKIRIGVDGGIIYYPIDDIGEQMGLGSDSFRIGPGYQIGFSADYTIWRNLGLGADFHYGEVELPDEGADRMDFYQYSAFCYWAFPVWRFSIEPGVSTGISQVNIYNVQRDIFEYAEDEGSDISFHTPHASIDIRLVFHINNYINLQVLTRGNLIIAQDVAIPQVYANAGFVYSFGDKSNKRPKPEPVVAPQQEEMSLVLSTKEPVLIGTIYFKPDTDQILSGADEIKETIIALRKKYPNWKLKVVLEGFAAPVGSQAVRIALIKKRIEIVKGLLRKNNIPDGFLLAGESKIGKRQSVEKELWPGQRKVDIYFQLVK